MPRQLNKKQKWLEKKQKQLNKKKKDLERLLRLNLKRWSVKRRSVYLLKS